jgi:hypothetical protein
LHTDEGWIIVCTARDVTESRKAQEALRASERNLRTSVRPWMRGGRHLPGGPFQHCG